MKNGSKNPQGGSVRPVLIGAGNALEMTGKPWSWWRRHAAELGIELVRIGTASFAKADSVLAAVEAHVPKKTVVVDELAEMRERVRRAG